MRLGLIASGIVVLAVAGMTAGPTMATAAPPADIATDTAEAPVPPRTSSVGQGTAPVLRETVNEEAASTRTPQRPVLWTDRMDDLAPLVAALAVPSWEAVVEPGDTLDAMLDRSEMVAAMRVEVALALSAEFDLRQLQPGNLLTVAYRADGTPSAVTLAVDDGVRIEVLLDDAMTSRTLLPKTSSAPRAERLNIDGSIYASLDRAGVPSRFAVDLAHVLGGFVDFRRDLQGNERLSVLWTQTVLADGTGVGPPEMTYAALDLGEDRFEIVWPDEEGALTAAYLNGKALRTVSAPVAGARLSSAYGRRLHPVYGNYRLHTGVDYAAPNGTPINATGAGRVSFVGWRSGYGRTVEIAHGSDTMTRYAHLSAVEEGLAVGDRVSAGDEIGHVGRTGTATAPNLHYEVRVEGRPIDPLGEHMPVAEDVPDLAIVAALLAERRIRFTTTLGNDA